MWLYANPHYLKWMAEKKISNHVGITAETRVRWTLLWKTGIMNAVLGLRLLEHCFIKFEHSPENRQKRRPCTNSPKICFIATKIHWRVYAVVCAKKGSKGKNNAISRLNHWSPFLKSGNEKFIELRMEARQRTCNICTKSTLLFNIRSESKYAIIYNRSKWSKTEVFSSCSK